MSRPVLAAIAALSLSAALAPSLRAQGFEPKLPDDVLLYVGVEDVKAARKNFEASAFGRMIEDPGAADFKGQLKGLIDNFSKEAVEQQGVDPIDLLAMAEGPAAFVLFDVGAPPAPGQAPTVSCAFLVGVGQEGDAFLEKFEALFTKELESNELQRSTETEGETEVFVLREATPDEQDTQVRYGVQGSTFFAGLTLGAMSGEGHLGDLLAALHDEEGAEAPLSEARGFAESAAADAGPGDIRAYVDLSRIIDRVLAIAEEQGDIDDYDRTILDALGLRDLKSVAISSSMGAGGSSSVAEFRYGGQGGLVRLIDALLSPGDLALLDSIPGDAVSATDMRVDFARAYDVAMELFQEIQPEEAEMVRMQMDGMRQQLGFDVREDILGSLGAEIGYFVAAVDDPGEALPMFPGKDQNLALALALKDGAKLRDLLERGLTQTGMDAGRKRVEFQGYSIDTLPFPMPMPGMGEIHYAILDDLLAFSFSGELIRGILRRQAEDADLASVAGDEAVAGAVDAAGSGLVGVSASDGVETILGMFEGLQMMSVTVGGQSTTLTPPDSAIVEKYFKGKNVSVTTKEDGLVRVRMTAP